MRLTVRVHARSSRQRVVWDGRTLSLWVTAPAVDGAANRAVVATVAAWLGVRVGVVRIVSGEQARTKVVEVEGVSGPPTIL